MSKHWIRTARAPSNIALIKYMGKEDAEENLPANGSLSLTLDSLCTITEVQATEAASVGFEWSPEKPSFTDPRAQVPGIGDAGIARFVRHAERVLGESRPLLQSAGLELAPPARFRIRSANTFPASAGIASSASSFASLTLAMAAACAGDESAFQAKLESDWDFRRALARISRKGSGSSCRSFEGPWVTWEGRSAAAIKTGMPVMADIVLLIGTGPKSVSSSSAHRLVTTSPLYAGRVERVTRRLRLLEAALVEANFREASRIAWAETWEMHSLFHTCSEPFTYWEPGTVRVLKWAAKYLNDGMAPPILTMDAGANVHLLVPEQLLETWKERVTTELDGIEFLCDRQGAGGSLVG